MQFSHKQFPKYDSFCTFTLPSCTNVLRGPILDTKRVRRTQSSIFPQPLSRQFNPRFIYSTRSSMLMRFSISCTNFERLKKPKVNLFANFSASLIVKSPSFNRQLSYRCLPMVVVWILRWVFFSHSKTHWYYLSLIVIYSYKILLNVLHTSRR